VTIRIVCDSDQYWVIEKPAGLLSQKDSGGEDSLVQEIQKFTGAKFVGLVHRLDRNTSGLMLVAKNPRSADHFTRDLQNDRIVRRYEALVWGQLPSDFSWEHHLEKNPAKNHVTVFRRPSPQSKEARLTGRLVKELVLRNEKVSWIEFELQTGRSHQIRCQAAFEGHPVLGDRRYGRKLPPPLQEFSRPALHSSFLSFRDPAGQEVREFHSPLDFSLFENGVENIA
jgi:23S rRNA pseudouridine1911/1915/1917 synthase